MAAKSNKLQTALTIKYKTGKDKNGKDIIKGQKFSRVKIAASDQSVYDAANALGGLLMYPVTDIIKEDESQIVNE